MAEQELVVEQTLVEAHIRPGGMEQPVLGQRLVLPVVLQVHQV